VYFLKKCFVFKIFTKYKIFIFRLIKKYGRCEARLLGRGIISFHARLCPDNNLFVGIKRGGGFKIGLMCKKLLIETTKGLPINYRMHL